MSFSKSQGLVVSSSCIRDCRHPWYGGNGECHTVDTTTADNNVVSLVKCICDSGFSEIDVLGRPSCESAAIRSLCHVAGCLLSALAFVAAASRLRETLRTDSRNSAVGAATESAGLYTRPNIVRVVLLLTIVSSVSTFAFHVIGWWTRLSLESPLMFVLMWSIGWGCSAAVFTLRLWLFTLPVRLMKKTYLSSLIIDWADKRHGTLVMAIFYWAWLTFYIGITGALNATRARSVTLITTLTGGTFFAFIITVVSWTLINLIRTAENPRPASRRTAAEETATTWSLYSGFSPTSPPQRSALTTPQSINHNNSQVESLYSASQSSSLTQQSQVQTQQQQQQQQPVPMAASKTTPDAGVDEEDGDLENQRLPSIVYMILRKVCSVTRCAHGVSGQIGKRKTAYTGTKSTLAKLTASVGVFLVLAVTVAVASLRPGTIVSDTPLIFFMAMLSTAPSIWLLVNIFFLTKSNGSASTLPKIKATNSSGILCEVAVKTWCGITSCCWLAISSHLRRVKRGLCTCSSFLLAGSLNRTSSAPAESTSSSASGQVGVDDSTGYCPRNKAGEVCSDRQTSSTASGNNTRGCEGDESAFPSVEKKHSTNGGLSTNSRASVAVE